MTPEQLDALRWHTPAPWVNKCTEYGYRYVQTPYGHTFVAYTTSPQSMSDGDARLITATPDLIAHIDEQQRKIQRLVNALERAADLLQDAIEGNDMPRLSDMDSINAALDISELDPPHRDSPDYVEHMKREAAAIRERYTGVPEIERQLAKARAEAEYWRNMNDRLEREIKDLRREEGDD